MCEPATVGTDSAGHAALAAEQNTNRFIKQDTLVVDLLPVMALSARLCSKSLLGALRPLHHRRVMKVRRLPLKICTHPGPDKGTQQSLLEEKKGERMIRMMQSRIA
jgi:hypothetical protein